MDIDKLEAALEKVRAMLIDDDTEVDVVALYHRRREIATLEALAVIARALVAIHDDLTELNEVRP
jgi:hypothetical protein